jgi:murein DD-endopeptidase MepM/ murein hydrolase activator NlpD
MLAALTLSLLPACAPVQPRQGDASTLRPSGLQPAFAADVRCPGIASPFGARTRYDGSLRPAWAFGGRHGGIDISLAEGTPLLALASGTLVSKGEGGMLEGIFLWLRHSPEDTGQSYWVYSKYQHLQSLPDLALGATVTMGQVIARSGKTGTTGPHYGPAGYPHLHVTTLKSGSGDENVGARGSTGASNLIDPLGIYRDAAAGEARARPETSPTDPPRAEKAVPIPHATTDGHVRPPGTRLVWPLACEPRR